MFEQPLHRSGFVVQAESVDDRGAGVVQADDFHLGAFAAEFQDHLVERADRGQIPKMRVADVDSHFGERFLEIEGRDEFR